jgi:hypothetical protein
VPTWVYAVIAVLLIAVVAVAYFVKRLSTPKG